MSIILKNIKKEYKTKIGSFLALKNISFDILDGEIITIVGKSGCGKSTLLNIISGLDNKTSGNIIFDKHKPKISYMFQNDALLPWKTVLENAMLGLDLSGNNNEEKKNYVISLLKEYGLEKYINKKTSELSGGQKQRVALIRSLAINPDLLLLDEPFSALDYYNRILVSEDVRKIIKNNNLKSIIITHDIGEAITLGDRIIVLSDAPSEVKNIYKTNYKSNQDILDRRNNPLFNDLYQKIWRDLND